MNSGLETIARPLNQRLHARVSSLPIPCLLHLRCARSTRLRSKNLDRRSHDLPRTLLLVYSLSTAKTEDVPMLLSVNIIPRVRWYTVKSKFRESAYDPDTLEH